MKSITGLNYKKIFITLIVVSIIKKIKKNKRLLLQETIIHFVNCLSKTALSKASVTLSLD